MELSLELLQDEGFRMTMLNSFRFYLTLMASTLIFLWVQKRRRWWPLPMAAIPCAGTVVMTLMNFCMPGSNLKNLIVFGGAMLIIAAMALACFRIRWEEAAFCAVAGYSVQFIISLCGEMCFRLFRLSSPRFFLWQCLITLAAAPLAYLCYGRRLRQGQNMDLDRRALLPLMAGAILAEVVLCYNLRIQWMAYENQAHMVYDAVLLILCSVFILVAQFALLVQRNLEDELAIINQIRRKDHDQYQITSETIDLINHKCHDMRHQIRLIGQSANVTPEALAEMEKTINIYDSICRTGCHALDTILTEKSLYSQRSSIVIRCIADGSGLELIRDADIYSLFGNLLDNAIHAVQGLEEERRIISLTIKRRGELLSVNSYNCYAGEVIIRDGFPVTRSDPAYHGFGTKSMAAIVQKYGGTVSFQAKDGVFNLNMLFPLSDLEQARAEETARRR